MHLELFHTSIFHTKKKQKSYKTKRNENEILKDHYSFNVGHGARKVYVVGVAVDSCLDSFFLKYYFECFHSLACDRALFASCSSRFWPARSFVCVCCAVWTCGCCCCICIVHSALTPNYYNHILIRPRLVIFILIYFFYIAVKCVCKTVLHCVTFYGFMRAATTKLCRQIYASNKNGKRYSLAQPNNSAK